MISFTECVKKSHDVLQTEVSNLKTKTKIFAYFRKRVEEGVAYGWMDGQINIFPFGPSCISFCVKYIVSEQIVLQSSVSLSSM